MTDLLLLLLVGIVFVVLLAADANIAVLAAVAGIGLVLARRAGD